MALVMPTWGGRSLSGQAGESLLQVQTELRLYAINEHPTRILCGFRRKMCRHGINLLEYCDHCKDIRFSHAPIAKHNGIALRSHSYDKTVK